MFRSQTLMLFIFLFGILSHHSVLAQNERRLEAQTIPYPGATPAHMWEIGMHSGMAIGLGDIDFAPGIGGGFHIRRALDYIFSFRSELLLAKLNNEDTNDGTTKTSYQSGCLEMLVSLNNLVWSANKNRKTNIYGLVGGGLNRFKVDVITAISSELKPIDYTIQSKATVGVGLAVRMSDRFNLGIETKAAILFGKNADQLDAVTRRDGDVFSYSSLRLNFNFGNKEKKSEPLYWVNPMDVIMQNVTELKNKPSIDLTDTDADGVIDLLDQDNNTPPGVEVNTRGLPLDSDGDGIPNQYDAQPYPTSQPNANIVEPIATEADIERIVQKRLNEYDRTGLVPEPGNSEKGSGYSGEDDPIGNLRAAKAGNPALVNWFLPLIHFDIDSYKVRYADFGNLSSIAKMIKANPELRIVVTGFTDKTASRDYNLDLSYQRAQAAIDYFVNVHGVKRGRLILQYNGEDDPLVPSTGSNMMNRRVEFRMAVGAERDMPKPSPQDPKKGRR